MRAGLIALLALHAPCLATPYSVETTPTADAFVRSMDPEGNYGGAGGLSASGSAALNRQGQQMGTLDTFMRFDLADLVAEMDSHFGGLPWLVEGLVLHLTEQGAPNNPIFNRGVGRFEVRWIEADDWLEGTGTPRGPTTDGVTFSDEATLLSPLADVTLGTFYNSGVDGELSFELGLAPALVQDILAGGEMSLFLTAVDDSVGFTFNSHDITPPRLPPWLEARAEVIPEPGTMALLALGLCAVARRGRTRR